MKRYDTVAIGGSIGGMVSTVTSRRYSPEKSILLIRKENRALVPCGIPYIFGTLGGTEKNLLPEEVYEKNKIDVMRDEVIEINPNNKTVYTKSGVDVEYEKLIIATGSRPTVPPIPGIDKKNIFTVKKDVSYLQQILSNLKGVNNLIIVGGGFIGVEFADECKKNRDINVKIVELLPHCLMLAFDKELCIAAENILKERGIEILTSEKVEAFIGNDAVNRVKLASGKELKADAVISCIGVVPEVALAEKAGLSIGLTKSIQVNRYMQTTDDNIFACGDCAEKISFFDSKPSNLKLGSIAGMEARIAGANLFSVRRSNRGVVGVFSTSLSSMCFAVAGLTEIAARESGYNIVIGQAEAINRHPGMMPGAKKLEVKLVFEKGTGVILGGQVYGAESGGELINVISAFIQQKITANDIATFQMGTHPALTSSPIVYQLVNAAEMAIKAMR